jgi:hypothetical protein
MILEIGSHDINCMSRIAVAVPVKTGGVVVIGRAKIGDLLQYELIKASNV